MNAEVIEFGSSLPLSNPAVDEYANKFIKHANKTAESVLEMCRVVKIAKDKLTTAEYKIFRNRIELYASDSTLSKLYVIGDKYDLMKKYSSYLPSSWTILYSLTKLTEAQMAAGVAENKISPIMVSGDVAKIIDPEGSKKRNVGVIKSEYSVSESCLDALFSIPDYADLEEASRASLIKEIAEVCRKYKCELVVKEGGQ